jgi:hypothetical protein
MAEQRQIRPPARYQIPTHLDVEDKIISFNGIGLTVRQAFLLVLGWSLTVDVWRSLESLHGLGFGGLALRLLISALPGLVSCIIAWTKVSGRHLESWLLIVLLFYSKPKLYLWRSLASHPVPARQRAAARRGPKAGASGEEDDE